VGCGGKKGRREMVGRLLGQNWLEKVKWPRAFSRYRKTFLIFKTFYKL
jgi:hypothetical protein